MIVFVQKQVKKPRFGQNLFDFCPNVGKKVWIWTKMCFPIEKKSYFCGKNETDGKHGQTHWPRARM